MAGLTLGFARSLGDFGVTLMVAGNIPGERVRLLFSDNVHMSEAGRYFGAARPRAL